MQERYGSAADELAVTLLSFGFKHGLPAEADIVLDVRFLPNPFFVPNLSALSGEDEAVSSLRAAEPDTRASSTRPRSCCACRSRVPARGQVLRHRGHRLHRRAAPVGRDAKELAQRLRKDIVDLDPASRHPAQRCAA